MSQPLTKLLQILTFTNVAPSATVSLPYDLNQNGAPVVPDLIMGDANGFTVTADDTQVSVTNGNGGPTTIHVLCWRVHTLARELGGAISDLTPQPFVIAGGPGAGGTPPPTTEHVNLASGGTVASNPAKDVTFVDGGAHGSITVANGTVDGQEHTIITTFIADGNVTIGGPSLPTVTISSGDQGSVILRWDNVTTHSWYVVAFTVNA